MSDEVRYGWGSDFPTFRDTSPRVIRGSIQELVRDASAEQILAWDASIPELQREVGEVLACDAAAERYAAILEYELPMESRRPDVVFLIRGPVVVAELKGKVLPSRADIDQAAAYARDLRCYHRHCEGRSVVPILVPTRAKGYLGDDCGVRIMGPDVLDEVLEELARTSEVPPIPIDEFVSAGSYRPLPSLVEAARELFLRGEIRPIHRARAATDPAIEEISRVVHAAAARSERRLVLVTGVPGAGKTLVGLRAVHAHYLDDLAVPRTNGRPTAPAVFLSGNGPLVQVLQYELRAAGGGGKAFVRGVKDYVKRYSGRRDRVPPEHVLVFDEAQRAFDADQVQLKHRKTPGFEGGKSEPDHFIEFAERVPGWCVVVGLIGEGQEIHVGEEAGLVQWLHAIEGSRDPASWQVHGPPSAAGVFAGSSVAFSASDALNLDIEIRYHLARHIHTFVDQLLCARPAVHNAAAAGLLEEEGYHLRITRQLEVAKQYLRDRYAEDIPARFGLVASSRDTDLIRFGIPNTWQATKNVRFGPWYSDPEGDPARRSCRHLEDCVTEFGAQGLELDAALLAWGTDLRLEDGRWSNAKARRYSRGTKIRDPYRLRLNAYRVLLTRGRDGTVIFVPDLAELDETYEYLVASGGREL